MNTLTRDFIERQPKVMIQPDAEYTCTSCYHHGEVARVRVAEVQVFRDRLTILCGGCLRAITLIAQ